MRVKVRWMLSFVILAVVFSSCIPQAKDSPEEEIARQWAEIESKYPEASRAISYALLHIASPLPGEDEKFEYSLAHYLWAHEIGQCVNALLLALVMPDSCLVDLSKIQPPDPGIVLPPRAQCIKDCMNNAKPYNECLCDCAPELCFP